MKLQIALDLLNKKEALKICRKVKDHIDIIELGTPLIKKEGLKIIREFKGFGKLIFADLKTMDTGYLEAELAFKYGANIVSVCGAGYDATIQGVIKAGKTYKGKVLVDLIGVKKPKKRAKEVFEFGPDFVCVHTGIDMQKKGSSPLNDLKKVSRIVGSENVAVAGGINLKNIDEIVKYKPYIIIVGGAITKSKNPESIARKLKNKIK